MKCGVLGRAEQLHADLPLVPSDLPDARGC